jgi:hypothetical protein
MPLKTLYLEGTAVSDIRPLQGMRLEELSLANTKVSDLSALRGMPLTFLNVGAPAVTDLTPLRGIAIKRLWLTGTAVTDLGPLRGMPLEVLSLSSNTSVSDLSVLRGMALIELRLRACDGITDLLPLEGVKGSLRLLILPPNVPNIEFLRGFPSLERMSFADDPKNNYRPDRSVTEFWREYDSREAHAHARASRWAEARKGFERTIALHPEDHFSRYMLAVLLAHLDDREAYHAQCHEMLARYANTRVPEVMERTAKSCLLLSVEGADIAAATRLADKSVTFTSNQYIDFFQFVQGLAQYRGGDYLAADATLSELEKSEGKNYVAVARVCVLAMAQQRLGKTQEAKASLALADTRVKEILPTVDAVDLGKSWNDVLIARMLFNEARELIEKK